MTWSQAAAYFMKEALVGLFRGWRTSLLAILTIAVSLFLTGVFLLLSTNLRVVIEGWRAESRLTIYLEDDATDEDLTRIAEAAEAQPWTARATTVDAEAARVRFTQAYPSMADLLEGFDQSPLPSAVEVEVDWSQVATAGSAFREALEVWRNDPAITSVDDDRDWLDQLEAIMMVLRGLAAVIAAVLITTAIFTIASVIRLIAHHHRDEIAVLRMVGATEFFIRGPFYAEGFIQGLLGGVAAIAALGTGFLALRSRIGDGLLGSFVTGTFLAPAWLIGLVALGGVAGLIGAVVSLSRERTGRIQQAVPGWDGEEDAA